MANTDTTTVLTAPITSRPGFTCSASSPPTLLSGHSHARNFNMPAAYSTASPAPSIAPTADTTNPSTSSSNRTCLGVYPEASSSPTSFARRSTASRKSIATSSSAARMSSPLNAISMAAKSVPPLLVASACSRIGWNSNPTARGSSVSFSAARRSAAVCSFDLPAGGAMRTDVASPNRLSNSGVSRFARLINAFGVAWCVSQKVSSAVVTRLKFTSNGACHCLIFGLSVTPGNGGVRFGSAATRLKGTYPANLNVRHSS